MEIVQRVDDYGRPAWIVLMILGFIFFWPIGLAILAFLIGSGRMGRWGCSQKMKGHWQGVEREWQNRNGGGWWGQRGAMRSSGNRAFDEYREATLKRLEDEQKEFRDFLERLRHAKDKEEFDQFMADRRTPKAPDAPAGDPVPQPQG